MKKAFFALTTIFFLCTLNILSAQDIPDGFVPYLVKAGDTLGKIAPNSKAQWDLIRKINRIDEFHLPVGEEILIPADLEKARIFCPVPENYGDPCGRTLVFFIGIQYFGVYEKGALAFWGPVSSGARGSTPKGIFQVMWKSRYYYSKKYEAAMPFAINFSSAGYFLHQQALPGKPASHGCIRLLKEDARKVFNWAEKDDVIIIL